MGDLSPQKGLKNWIFFVRRSLKLLRNSNEKIILLSTLMDILAERREKKKIPKNDFLSLSRKKMWIENFIE